MSKNENKKGEQSSQSPNIRVIVLICVLLWMTSALFVKFIAYEWDVRGQIGDSFGAVNALFSGLALAGVYYAVQLQRIEINESRASFQDQLRVAKQTLDLEKLDKFKQNEPILDFTLTIDKDDNTFCTMTNRGKPVTNLFLHVMDEYVIAGNTRDYYHESFAFVASKEKHTFLLANHRIEMFSIVIHLSYTNLLGINVSKSIILYLGSSEQNEIINSYTEKLDVEDLALHKDFKSYLEIAQYYEFRKENDA